MNDIEKYNFTNNLRQCYIDLFGSEVGNYSEFAQLCNISNSTIGRYLGGTVHPKSKTHVRELEVCLGKEEGYLLKDTDEVDFDPILLSWGQPKQRGRKKKHHQSDVQEAMFAAEDFSDTISSIADFDREELKEFLESVRKELRDNVSREVITKCPHLYKLAYGY